MMAVQLEVSVEMARMAHNAMALMATLPASFSLDRPKNAIATLRTCAVSRVMESIPYRPVDGHAIERARCRCCYPVVAVKAPVSAWEPDSPRDVSRCKALLLEVLRRAAHDWVLYRQQTRMHLRVLADDAYTWLFDEDEEHEYRRQRIQEMVEVSDGVPIKGARTLTSFLSICDSLDLDPDTVRERVRKMDVQTIIASGRPAETRKLRPGVCSSVEDHELTADVDVDSTVGQDFVSMYESYGSVSTPYSIGRGSGPEY